VVAGRGAWDLLVRKKAVRLAPADPGVEADGVITAPPEGWDRIARDVRSGMELWRSGHLVLRKNLHLGLGFLAATSGARDPGRLCFRGVDTESGRISILSAGSGDPVVLIHGLGATKGSFLATTTILASSFRAIAVDLPGFGDSDKPLLAPYHPPFFARALVHLLDALKIDRAHFVGNSLGGRVALELGLRYPDRTRRLVLLAPSLAWKRERRWAPLVRLLRPELGLIQLAPRRTIEGVVRRMIPAADNHWVAAGVDEFLRAYFTPRGRAAFYAAARQIYLEEPHGAKGFWTRLAKLEPEALFIWGKRDWLVPVAFADHVRRVLPKALHLELDCGHVPQLERVAETHAVLRTFLEYGAG
jgi:pimeloyl-ACP methyl ester carboxylesterase